MLDFEAAADAVISGDIAAIRTMLKDEPYLFRRHTTLEKHATHMHYNAPNAD